MTLSTPGRPVRARLLAAVASGIVATVCVTGCAAGQRAQTANEFSVVDGATANAGTMGLRDAGIAPPTVPAGYAVGSTATLSMTVVNSGTATDRLIAVSSPNATSVSITGPTTSAPTLSGAPSTPGGNGIAVVANGAVQVGSGAGAATITMHGLKSRLLAGESIPVTFSFQQAGQITVQLPVKLMANQTGGETVNVSPPQN